MKILILANSIGGLYSFRKELVEELVRLKHDVFISAPDGQFVSEFTEMGCNYIETGISRHGKNPFTDLKLLLKYKSIINETKPDIALTYTIKPNIYGGLACQIKHVPYLANVTGLGTSIANGGLLSRLSLFLYKKGLQGAKCVFFQNAVNRQFFLDRGIVNEERVKLLPGSGVNLDRFPFEQYPADGDGLRFLFVGRLMRDKGIGELLQAFGALHKENPKFSLDIVGSMEEAIWSEPVQKAIASGAVRYHGLQKDVRPFYKNSHCVVLPSYHEGMANVLLEASAMGRPVIATDVPGCRETYEEGVTGLACKARDADSLLQAMTKFTELDNGRRAEMGMKARQRVEQLFSRKFVVQKYLEML